MKWEHIQKEKEYGIPWRSAFKKEMKEMSDEVHTSAYGDDMMKDSDPLIVLKTIIKQDSGVAVQHDSVGAADQM